MKSNFSDYNSKQTTASSSQNPQEETSLGQRFVRFFGSLKSPSHTMASQQKAYNNDTLNIIKIAVIGDKTAGKSSLILRFSDDLFTPKPIRSLGVDYKVRTLNTSERRPVRLQMWDNPNNLRGAHYVIIVVDAQNPSSLEDLKQQVRRVAMQCNEAVKIVVAQTRADLNDSSQESMKILAGYVSKLSAMNKDPRIITVCSTSAKNGMGIEYPFQEIADHAAKAIADQEKKEQTFSSEDIASSSTSHFASSSQSPIEETSFRKKFFRFFTSSKGLSHTMVYQQNAYNEDNLYIIQIAVIGGKKTGKSSLILRFSDDMFTTQTIKSLGVDYKKRTFNTSERTPVRLHVWDNPNFLRGMQYVIIVVDAQNPSSFDDLKQQVRRVAMQCSEAVKIVVAQTRADLNKSSQEGMKKLAEYAETCKEPQIITVCSTSAKNGTGVKYLFQEIANDAAKQCVKQKDQSSPIEDWDKPSLVDTDSLKKSAPFL